jgi:CheY-like chemotaxis protein
MGGKLEAVSEENQGSTFSFEIDLPLSGKIEKVENIQVAFEVTPTSRSTGDLRILVAEDAPANRTLIGKFFSVLGYPVEFAVDGMDCIDRLSGNVIYDAVFLDLHMPHHGGIEIAGRIKNGEFGESVKKAKLAIMSADVFAEEQSKDLGIDNFISKPIDIAVLKDCLESIVPDKQKSRPLKALIVEDEALNRQMIGQILHSFGMESDYANDGVECIEFLEAHHDIDLILLDLRMPRMDGWTVARKIRNGEVGGNLSTIPIAVVSGEIQAEETCRELGVDEFIAKPFDLSQIRNFVNRVGGGDVALAG